jgi:hypothetical protein
MDKNSNKQKEEFARRLVEKEEEKDGISINQRAYKFNFNADKPRITYARQRIVFN